MTPAIIRDVVPQLCCTSLSQTVRGDTAIVDICVEAFGSITLFSLHVRESRHSDSTPDSRRVPLSVFGSSLQLVVGLQHLC